MELAQARTRPFASERRRSLEPMNDTRILAAGVLLALVLWTAVLLAGVWLWRFVD
jgi:hypothetical protein